jgi:hypothetical protein
MGESDECSLCKGKETPWHVIGASESNGCAWRWCFSGREEDKRSVTEGFKLPLEKYLHSMRKMLSYKNQRERKQ